MRKPIVVGNWKMNKTVEESKKFLVEFLTFSLNKGVDVVICAPYTSLGFLAENLRNKNVFIGAQNFHYESSGAFTGEISADMLAEQGVKYVIIGHSERRQYFAETDDTVNLKVKKALDSAITPIICVGETLEQRDNGETNSVIYTQITKGLKDISSDDITDIIIAYEPIWAIGTGKTASSKQANDVCSYIRKIISDIFGVEISNKIRIQYGGSVKPSNIKEIMEQSDIDGVLVGGASLVAEDFTQLVNF